MSNTEADAAETEIPEDTQAEEVAEAPEEGDADADADAAGSPDADAEGSVIMEVGGERLTFASNEEALAYAKKHIDKVETERIVADAYRAGVQDHAAALNRGAPAAPEPEAPIVSEEEFYANPTEALKKVEETARKKAKAEITQDLEAQRTEREVWETFCGLHPDLAEFREDVDRIASSPTHAPIIQALYQTKGQVAAMAYAAQKTRAKFQQYNEKSKTATVLPKGNGAGATPSGTRQSVTPAKKTLKPLSMAEQVKQLRQGKR